MQGPSPSTIDEIGAADQVGRYIARVAHELRTPVSLIAGSLENLQESMDMLVRYVAATEKYLGAHDEAARLRRDLQLDYRIENTPGLLRICSEGAQRLRHVVEQLRTQAQADRSHAAASADVAAVLRGSVAMARHERGCAATVVWNLAPDLGLVAGSEHFLGQVFLNIVRNAFDAVADAADPLVVITATVAETEGHASVVVIVRDDGPGIPPASCERVFDEFFTTKGEAGGVGLGLAISRDIVRALGGTITAGNHDHGGAEVRVVLPRVAST